MPKYLISKLLDPLLGLSTGVMAYYLWENDPRNAQYRPRERSLYDIVSRRLSNTPPPDHIFAGNNVIPKSIFSLPP